MGRLQPRRTRVAATAVISVFVLTYMLYPWTQRDQVTWHPLLGISTSTTAQEVQLPMTSQVTQPEIPSLAEAPASAKATISSPSAVVNSRPSPASILMPTLSSNSTLAAATQCVHYEQLQKEGRGPHSTGKRHFPYSRPSPECRTFNLPGLEKLIDRMNDTIKDPDLFRLFENSYPNTLDTMIKWRGYAKAMDPVTKNWTTTDEELTYIITGDIDAMWLRDSASQVYSYLPLLEASSDPDSLASLWRGLINIQSRYILISPYCHSFQPPSESGVPPTTNGAFHKNNPRPSYDPLRVFDCKWELDSLASFLQISTAYYQRTNDVSFLTSTTGSPRSKQPLMQLVP